MSKKITTEEILDLLELRKNGAKVAEAFTDYVDKLTFNSDEFINALLKADLSCKCEFSNICLLWVYKLNYIATKTENYDLRNKYSVDTGNLIYDKIGDYITSMFSSDELKLIEEYQFNSKEDYYNDNPLNFNINFVHYMYLSHKSLQQAFSGVVFAWLVTMPDDMNDIYQLICAELKTLNEVKPLALSKFLLKKAEANISATSDDILEYVKGTIKSTIESLQIYQAQMPDCIEKREFKAKEEANQCILDTIIELQKG